MEPQFAQIEFLKESQRSRASHALCAGQATYFGHSLHFAWMGAFSFLFPDSKSFQLKYLEEKRKREGKPGVSAFGKQPASAVPVQESTTSVSVPAIERLIIQEQVETSKPTKAQDVWRFTEGNGALGSYIVGRHKQTGTTVELWQEGSGSFTFVRSSGAGVKYCSSYGNMREYYQYRARRLPRKLCMKQFLYLASTRTFAVE